MANIGFYSGIKMIDESSVASANLEFNRDRIEREAQDLANECGCEIEAWTCDDDGERTSHTGITAKPIMPAQRAAWSPSSGLDGYTQCRFCEEYVRDNGAADTHICRAD
jgi:hypothetical protein